MHNSDHINNIINKVLNLKDLKPEEMTVIKSIMEYRTFNKGEIITNFGDIEQNNYIIIEGYLRMYSIVNDKEYTMDFYKANSIASSFESRITKQPSEYCIEACTDGYCYKIHNDVFDNNIKKNRIIEKVGRIIAEKMYIRRINKQIDLNTFSAKERYIRALKEWPGIIDKIPQHKIATYIGIAPESLSRLKK